MAEGLHVISATPSREAAIELARTAVQARLAAGAQITGPATSVFWHQGDFGTGEEWVLRLTTTTGRYAALERHLIERHPWQNPEIAAVTVVAGSQAYFEWVRRTVAPE